MSASSSPALISKSTDKMKLILTKDNRVRPILSKPPLETSVTKATTTPSVPKSVIKEPPSKINSDSSCTKPIVAPSVPNLLSIIKGQSTLSQFFSSSSVPPTNLTLPPNKLTAPPHTHSTTPPSTHFTGRPHTHSTAPPPAHFTGPPHTHSFTVTQHAKPIASFYDKIVQQYPQATLNTHSNLPSIKPKKSPGIPKLLPKKTTNTIPSLTKKPKVWQLENGVVKDKDKDKDIHPPNPKKNKVASGSSSLPLSRVRMIMKTHVQSSQNVVNTGQESVALITRAAVSVVHILNSRLLIIFSYRSCLLPN